MLKIEFVAVFQQRKKKAELNKTFVNGIILIFFYLKIGIKSLTSSHDIEAAVTTTIHSVISRRFECPLQTQTYSVSNIHIQYRTKYSNSADIYWIAMV